MFGLLHELKEIPDISMIGLIYGLLGFMALLIGVGWISKILTADRATPRKPIPQGSNNRSVTRKRALPSKRMSR